MAVHGEADGVLETFHKGSVARTELVLALVGRVVGNHEGNASHGLDLEELQLEPLEHITRVFALTPSVPVKTVTSLRVVGEDVGVVWQLLVVQKLDLLAVVAVLAELLIRLI